MGILSFIDKVCVQTAVYWAPGTKDGYGDISFVAGVEVSVRWDGSSIAIVNKQGKQIASRAEIMINQALDDNGYLYLGSLASLTAPQIANPRKVEKAYMIQKIETTPLFASSTEKVYTVYL